MENVKRRRRRKTSTAIFLCLCCKDCLQGKIKAYYGAVQVESENGKIMFAFVGCFSPASIYAVCFSVITDLTLQYCT